MNNNHYKSVASVLVLYLGLVLLNNAHMQNSIEEQNHGHVVTCRYGRGKAWPM